MNKLMINNNYYQKTSKLKLIKINNRNNFSIRMK